MDRVRVILAATIALIAAVTAHADDSLESSILKVTRDRFTGDITLEGKFEPTLLDSFDVRPLAFIGRNEGAVLSDISLVITRSGEEWRYLNCHMTHWLVDGKPFKLPKALRFHSNVGTGYVLEMYAVRPIPPDDLSALATAKQIELKICNDERILAADVIAEIRELARLLPLAIKELRGS